MKTPFLAALGILLMLSGCKSSSANTHQDTWAKQNAGDYSFHYREICFCPQIVARITVRDGKITEAKDPESGKPLMSPDGSQTMLEAMPQRFKTIDQLFQEIADAKAQDPASLTEEYDPELGYPTHFYVDISEQMADEEHGFDVKDLVIE